MKWFYSYLMAAQHFYGALNWQLSSQPSQILLVTEPGVVQNLLVICSITHFRNRIPGCNYLGTWT